MQKFSFYGDISARISGEGKVYDDLSEYYQSYTTTSAQGEADFYCTVESFSPEAQVAVGDPNLYYGRDNDRFVIENTSSGMSHSEDWNDVICTPGTSKNSVAYLLECEMRK